MNKNRLIMSFLVVASTQTGCTTSMLNNDEFRLSGTPEGIRAFSETLEGIGIIAKTDQESLPANPHSALRLVQAKGKVLKFTSKHSKGGK